MKNRAWTLAIKAFGNSQVATLALFRQNFDNSLSFQRSDRFTNVPKEQSTIARRFNAGLGPRNSSPEGTAESIPQISLVILDAVFFEQSQKLKTQ